MFGVVKLMAHGLLLVAEVSNDSYTDGEGNGSRGGSTENV